MSYAPGTGGRIGNAYFAVKQQRDATPWYRFLKRRKLREEMRTLAYAIAASMDTP